MNKSAESSVKRFYIASLGCPKNTVDSNGMAVLLQRVGYQATLNAQEADVIIVNTCGFIDVARQESLETLLDLSEGLRSGQRLIAAGCWAQRDPAFLKRRIPRLSAILGTRSWGDIVALADGQHYFTPIERSRMQLPEDVRAPGYVISGRSAFLKIADGCSRACAFCAIPGIKGPGVSRSSAAILDDARELQALGVLEINLIAQDSTAYGHDRGEKDGLAELLERLVEAAPDVPWIRILYAFPGYLTPRLLEVMQHPQILPYIDIPLQHAHPDVLRRMRRPADMDEVRATLAHWREQAPRLALRTAFIVGFPGETTAEFSALMDFTQEMRFDRVGVFLYSHESGTAAAALADNVPAQVKAERQEALMVLQQGISQQSNLAWVGKQMAVLLEGCNDGLTVGRSYRDAPEIDGLVLIRGEYAPHRIVSVEIVDATVYDLVGQMAEPPLPASARRKPARRLRHRGSAT